MHDRDQRHPAARRRGRRAAWGTLAGPGAVSSVHAQARALTTTAVTRFVPTDTPVTPIAR
jgi:hypothetical protein